MPTNESIDIDNMRDCSFKYKVLQYRNWGFKLVEARELKDGSFYARMNMTPTNVWVEITWDDQVNKGQVEFINSTSDTFPRVFKF